MTAQLDLQQLAFDRNPSQTVGHGRRSPLISRYLLPGTIVFGFLAMLGWATRDSFIPAKPVTVVPVIVSREKLQHAGTPLFQAAGWIEPRPTPVLVPALAEGIIEELLVVEGQQVDAGQPLARLIDADAMLALKQAQANASLADAELQSARAELLADRQRLENPVHLQAVLSEAESLLAKIETELSRTPLLIEAAEAKSLFAQQNLQGKQAALAALPGRSIQEAQSLHSIAVAELKELIARHPRLEREREALQKRSEALRRQLELVIDEKRKVATSEAQVKAAEARLRLTELLTQAAQLRLDRMVIKAPISGRVLALVARPGSRVMGLDPGGEQRASTVVSMYDPQRLQVRADVRLEDVPFVQSGQLVQIETASVKGALTGQVLQVTSQANIQKNTLEVKVAIDSPPSEIRPEMLVTTSFLAVERPQSESDDAALTERLLVPRELVETAGENTMLWVVDPQGYARRRIVRLGKAGTDQLVETIDGLSATDRLICNGRATLTDGDRVRITSEDGHLGVASMQRN